MTQKELTGAAHKLAYYLGIPVYIRAGKIYRVGPGNEVLPSKSARPIPLEAPREELVDPKTDQAE